jgi:hypothetical protein
MEQLIMTSILDNALLVCYDLNEQKLVMYRLVGDLPKRNVLHTEYPISKLKALALDEAGRMIGEDILISISGTREALIDPPLPSK